MFSIYTSFQTMWTKLHAIFKIWFYSNSVLLYSSVYFLLFSNIAWVTSWPVLFKEPWTRGLRPLFWVELLFYHWMQKVRVGFHGCFCILNFTCHLLPCHIKSVIKWYSQANWTASCYQNRLSHSAFPLCFHLIPRCTIFVCFCHWCDLSAVNPTH